MREMHVRRLAAALGVMLVAGPLPLPAQDRPPADVLTRAAHYVTIFLDRFANVVTEERLEQRVTTPFSSRTEQREMRSDLLFVKAGTAALDWSEWRDVFEVDGRPVRGREDRLLKLFAAPSAGADSQARRLLAESARFNIGPERDTNTPVLPLLFLLPSMQDRFVFEVRAPDVLDGRAVLPVSYEERARPTVVRGARGEDRPATGTFWIDDRGRVLKSEMSVVFGANSWRMTTTFADDAVLDLAVPVDMVERFEVDFVVVTGHATYGQFRTFGVSTGERLQPGR